MQMGGVAGKERGEQPLNAKAPPPPPEAKANKEELKT